MNISHSQNAVKDITILVIDDEPDAQQNIKEYFERQQHNPSYQFKVFLASNTTLGLALALEKKPGCIILDWIFYKDDGTQARDFLNKRKDIRQLATTFLIVFSVFGNDANIKRAALDGGAALAESKYVEFVDRDRGVELLCKIVLRHFDSINPTVIKEGLDYYDANPNSFEAKVGNQPSIDIRGSYYDIWELLVQKYREKSYASHEDIWGVLNTKKGYDNNDKNVLQQKMKRLRDGLRDENKTVIEAIRGKGYRLRRPDS